MTPSRAYPSHRDWQQPGLIVVVTSYLEEHRSALLALVCASAALAVDPGPTLAA